MNSFIDINNRTSLREMLMNLNATTKPLWGKMKPQQMVEHLLDSVEYTNGRYTCRCDLPPEEARRLLDLHVYSDKEIPRNVILGTLPVQYRFDNLWDAVEQLLAELEMFDHYYTKPGITAVHAGFGPMNHQQWLMWHGKHFTHHLKQFNLIAI